MRISIDTMSVTRDGKETHEYKAVFHYQHLEEIAKQMMLDHLLETEQLEMIPGEDELRVESTYCEPDGDMGWRGSVIKIDLMIGAANYYPRLMEAESWEVDSKTKTSEINVGDIPNLRQRSLWKRLLGMFQ